LSSLKLRVSYGSLGNNSVGNYDAYSTYSTRSYVLNNTLALGVAQTEIANSALKWERTFVTDFGMFDN